MDKSPIQPHNAGQVVNCTGSVLMQIQCPPCDTGVNAISQERLEGRAFHEIAEHMLNAYRPDNNLVCRIQTVGTMSKDNIIITDEIFDAAEDFAKDVITTCTGNLSKMVVEQRVELSHLFPGTYGFADVWLYDEPNNHLIIWEGKYGHGIVEVFENYQLLSYVSGIVEKLGINDTSLRVTMRIVQPRGFHRDGPIREWSNTLGNLQMYFNTLQTAFNNAYVDPKCNAGTWCKTCDGRYGCETLQRTAMDAIDYSGDVFNGSLSGDSLALELRILQRASDAIKNRLTGLEAQAISELRAGEQLPGYQILQGTGRKRWKRDIDVEQVIMMGDLMGEDLRKPRELLTPTQILKKGVDESVINLYSETPKTSLKLVGDDNSALARKTFK